MSQERTFIDRGGTFTDVVSVDEEGVSVRKVRSDTAVAGQLARGPLTLGTTVATNALLERQGVKTLLIVTAGFADLPSIRDQTRPELFDPDASWPPSLANDVVETSGRIDKAGREIEPLSLEELPQTLQDVAAIAVVLLNSHVNASHEARVAAHLKALAPSCYIAQGHHVAPELGYLARIETTLLDASITPILQESMARDRLAPDTLAMRSDGSLVPAAELRAPDAVLSGPAGGVLAVASIAEQAGFAHAIGLDMGGTSTDVCRVSVGEPLRRQHDAQVGGLQVRRPMLEMVTIAAGGGSILSNDGLRLRVGPRSAGANPGPACYGRGGPPTLTDAALIAGLVDAEAFTPPLDRGQVQLPGDCDEFLSIAREKMAQAVRQLATRRGVDLRKDHALVAYGGAAGQHAAYVADLVGIDTVLIHPCAAVLSAWGQSLARREESRVKAIWKEVHKGWSELVDCWQHLADELSLEGSFERSVELRYEGTDHLIEVFAHHPTSLEALTTSFREIYHQEFGFERPELAIEIVNARVRVREASRKATHVQRDPWNIGDETRDGPTVIMNPTTSIAVPAKWRASRRHGLLYLERCDAMPAVLPHRRSPYAVELWFNRFQAIAKESGAVLERLARSVNIRERHDYSCAIFDGSGRLVANAAHIPVHLGAMGETVRDLIQRVSELRSGQSWVCNDPRAGGSHLPDLTVITAVGAPPHRCFVASRAHHVDVGGLSPGSMPPHSRRLEDEGIILRHLPLLDANDRLVPLERALTGCRDIPTVIADLSAQIAANNHAARQLEALGDATLVHQWMAHLYDVAAETTQKLIERLQPGEAKDQIRGIPLQLNLSTNKGRLQVDLSRCGGPDPGNLNAPPAVVRAAVLYAIRLMVDRPIPLNEGALHHVDIHLGQTPSIVSPPPTAAIVGGNVETSQRIVDLMLRATQQRAASQGTMNNLTLGGDKWSVYETIGGGTGATSSGPGRSGGQVHMTNTRATDPEVLEARLPLRLRRFAYRRHSGGRGRHRGGDGLIREVEVTTKATAALLATRQQDGAPGLAGGHSGAPGHASVYREGHWQPWSGDLISLNPGDRVRVETPGGGAWGEEPGDA